MSGTVTIDEVVRGAFVDGLVNQATARLVGYGMSDADKRAILNNFFKFGSVGFKDANDEELVENIFDAWKVGQFKDVFGTYDTRVQQQLLTDETLGYKRFTVVVANHQKLADFFAGKFAKDAMKDASN